MSHEIRQTITQEFKILNTINTICGENCENSWVQVSS